MVQAALNAAAAPHGLEFGPDTSTVDQATIAGMVGNNSSGSRSIVYGESKDKVLRISGVLAGGEAATFGACAGGDLAAGVDGPAGERLAAALAQVRERYREPIATGFPQTRRCTSGYNLRELLAPEPNLGRLLAGSEGTLALFTELEVLLDPRPARRVGAAFTFSTLRAALEANVAILETAPSAVEFLDLAPLRRAPNIATFRRMAALLAGGDAAMLTVEYQGSEDEALAGLARLRALAGELGAAQEVWLEQPDDLAEAAALRRAVLPLLMGAPGAERPASFVEDTAVAPERLADFVADLQRIVASHGARASFTGHASAGCLHIRPLLDLKTASGVARMEALAGGRSAAWSPTTTARSRASTASDARAAGSCRSCSARACTRRWSRSRTRSTRGACSTPASSWTARRSPSRSASAPTTAATTAGPRGSPTRPRAASAWPSRSASAPACARSSPAPCALPPRPRATSRAPRGRGPTRCRASCAGRCRWRRSARTSSRTCSAPASPARRARPSARPAWTWPRSRSSGWRRSARERACRCSRAASATSAAWPASPRRSRRS